MINLLLLLALNLLLFWVLNLLLFLVINLPAGESLALANRLNKD
jgi:hypothetical protein